MKYPCIETDIHLKSIMNYGEANFPFLLFNDDFDYYLNNCINLHWHNQVEFAVVMRGVVEYRVGEKNILLHKDEGIFVNSNVLHMGKAHGSSSSAEMFSIAFSVDLIAAAQSVVYEDYIFPVITDRNVPYIHIKNNDDWGRTILEKLWEIYGVDKNRGRGYQLLIHNRIGEIWENLVFNYPKTSDGGADTVGQERLKTMLIYINTHFDEDVSLAQVAASANISKRTCSRTFQNYLGISVLEYLKSTRMNTAMSMLINEEISVSEIAARCGFDSPSYFTLVFRETIGMTPLDYRHEMKEWRK